MCDIRKTVATEKNKIKDTLRNNRLYKIKREITAGMKVKS